MILTVGPIHLEPMGTDEVKSDLIVRNLSISQAVFNGIASVDWVGDC